MRAKRQTMPDALTPEREIERMADVIFGKVAHGDEAHQDWLRKVLVDAVRLACAPPLAHERAARVAAEGERDAAREQGALLADKLALEQMRGDRLRYAATANGVTDTLKLAEVTVDRDRLAALVGGVLRAHDAEWPPEHAERCAAFASRQDDVFNLCRAATAARAVLRTLKAR